jgi:hypothetical protein
MAKNARGRPKIPKGQHTDRSGFTSVQRRQLRSEARKRKVPMAVIVREMADFYFAALEQSRNVQTIHADKP